MRAGAWRDKRCHQQPALLRSVFDQVTAPRYTPPAPQRCLTPPSALEGDCGFLAANLYARR